MRKLVWFAFFISNGFSKDISQNDLIGEINSAQNMWKAAPNQFTILNHEKKKIYLGTELGKTKLIHKRVYSRINRLKKKIKIPSEFDARRKWRNCKSIGSIKDQGECSSDWAVSTATIASDRLCIASKYEINVNLSIEELVSCDSWCGGCKGCDYEYPWIYLLRYGIVTGGDYESNEGCKPYSFKPCGSDCIYSNMTTPNCTDTCTNTAYSRSYNKDKYFGLSLYELPARNTRAIQTDILTHGPVSGMMKIYEDFYSYKEGIYAYVRGDFLGYHSVKILGWGSEKGINYWLVANSWGKGFGQNGFFKIRRGINECFIEGRIIASRLKV